MNSKIGTTAILITALVLAPACGVSLDDLGGDGKDKEDEGEEGGSSKTTEIPDTGCEDALVQESYPERYVYQQCVPVAGSNQLMLPLDGQPDLTTVSVIVDGAALGAGEFTATYDAAAKQLTVTSDKFVGASLIDVSVTGSGSVNPPNDTLNFGFLMVNPENPERHVIHGLNESEDVASDVDVSAFVNKYVAFKYPPDPCQGNWLLCDAYIAIKDIIAAPTEEQPDAIRCETARGTFEAELSKLKNAEKTCSVDADCTFAPAIAKSYCGGGGEIYSQLGNTAHSVARLHGANAEVFVFCEDTGNELCTAEAHPTKAVCDTVTKQCVGEL
jgi:hypothetical protein